MDDCVVHISLTHGTLAEQLLNVAALALLLVDRWHHRRSVSGAVESLLISLDAGALRGRSVYKRVVSDRVCDDCLLLGLRLHRVVCSAMLSEANCVLLGDEIISTKLGGLGVDVKVRLRLAHSRADTVRNSDGLARG